MIRKLVRMHVYHVWRYGLATANRQQPTIYVIYVLQWCAVNWLLHDIDRAWREIGGVVVLMQNIIDIALQCAKQGDTCTCMWMRCGEGTWLSTARARCNSSQWAGPCVCIQNTHNELSIEKNELTLYILCHETQTLRCNTTTQQHSRTNQQTQPDNCTEKHSTHRGHIECSRIYQDLRTSLPHEKSHLGKAHVVANTHTHHAPGGLHRGEGLARCQRIRFSKGDLSRDIYIKLIHMRACIWYNNIGPTITKILWLLLESKLA